MAKLVPDLSKKQKAFVDLNWDKMKFVDLIRGTFQSNALDGRSVEAKAVKDYLGDREPIPTLAPKLPAIILTPEQEELIKNNARKSSMELARLIFSNNHIGPLSLESRTVHAFRKTLPPEVTGLDDDEVSDEYKPSSSYKQIVAKVNEYLMLNLDVDKLNEPQKMALTQLMNFMNSPRYLQMINSYSSRTKRRIFEGEFIRTVWDKLDLTIDDVNLCINLCFNYVHMITINKHKDMLDERYECSLADPESKTSVALAEMIKAKTAELKNCDERQQKLLQDLSSTRSARNKNKPSNDISVAKLIDWWRQEEERKKALKFAEIRNKAVMDEAEKLDSMEEIYCRIMGLSKSELVNG